MVEKIWKKGYLAFFGLMINHAYRVSFGESEKARDRDAARFNDRRLRANSGG